MSVKLLFFAGSAREGSVNKKLAKLAHDLAAEKGADTTFLDLKDHPLPLFDEDLEASGGMPEHAARLKAILSAHDGFFIASPEYNSSIPPLVKNTIDWLSRPHEENEQSLIAFLPNGSVV